MTEDLQPAEDLIHLSWLDYQADLLEKGLISISDYAELEKARQDFSNDPSHKGKLVKVQKVDKKGKKVSKWISPADLATPVDAKGQPGQVADPKKTYQPHDRDELAHHAKHATAEQLAGVVKQSGDPELRRQAHHELVRRQKEEVPAEEIGPQFTAPAGYQQMLPTVKLFMKFKDQLVGKHLGNLQLAEFLSKQFSYKKTSFVYSFASSDNDEYDQLGLSGAALLEDGNIQVQYRDNFWENFEEKEANQVLFGKTRYQYMAEVVDSLIRHEEVHKQVLGEKITYLPVYQQELTPAQYLSRPDELQAQALSIVDDLTRKGYSPQQAEAQVYAGQADESAHFKKYQDLFDSNDQVFSALQKEVTKYISNLKKIE